MKVLIIFVGLVLALARADLAKEREKLKVESQKCEAELGEPKNLLQKLLRKEDIGNKEKAGKMALCINVKCGHMDENGDLIPDEFKEHVDRLTDNYELRKKIVTTCGPTNNETPEEKALNFVECMQRLLPQATPTNA